MAAFVVLVSCTTQKKEPGNPFFAEWKTPFGVPPFEQIMSEHYMPVIDSGITLARADIVCYHFQS